jgi:hypothetical protein
MEGVNPSDIKKNTSIHVAIGRLVVLSLMVATKTCYYKGSYQNPLVDKQTKFTSGYL